MFSDDTESLRTEVAKLRAMQMRTMQLLAISNARLDVLLSLAMGIRSNMGCDCAALQTEVGKKDSHALKRWQDRVFAMIAAIEPPPPTDVWWDQPPVNDE